MVSDGDKALLSLFLLANDAGKWELVSFDAKQGIDPLTYQNAVKDFVQKTGSQNPAYVFAYGFGFQSDGYVYDPDIDYLRAQDGSYYKIKDVEKSVDDNWQEIKDLFDDNGKYCGNLKGGINPDPLGVAQLTPVQPTQQTNTALVVVFVIAGGGVLAVAMYFVFHKKSKT